MTSTPQTWTQPGPEEVAPGVHRVPLPLPNDGLRAVNVYVLTTGAGFVLVDGGWAIPQSRSLLADALAELGGGLGDVRRFLVTHMHRDHYTQAVAVRRELGGGPRVGLGLGEKPTLDLVQRGEHRPLDAQIERLAALGAGELSQRVADMVAGHRVDPAQWESPDDWLVEGPVELADGRVLEAVATPGHTAGHLVFADDAAGLLFAGDHVLPTITPSIGFEPLLQQNPLGDFLRSLALVRARPDAVLLPAHGPVAPSVHARVDELVAHHGARLDETERAARSGAGTAYAVAGQLRWTRREHRLAALDDFNAMLAVFETAAHLDLLVAQGRLTRRTADGVACYE